MFRYLPLMLKNSLRNRRRSLLTIFSIAASLCLLGVLFALYRGLFLAPPSAGAGTAPGDSSQSLDHAADAGVLSKTRSGRCPGVREAMIWQWFGGTYKDARDRRNFFARFCVEPDRFFRVRPEIEMPEDQKQAFHTCERRRLQATILPSG